MLGLLRSVMLVAYHEPGCCQVYRKLYGGLRSCIGLKMALLAVALCVCPQWQHPPTTYHETPPTAGLWLVVVAGSKPP